MQQIQTNRNKHTPRSTEIPYNMRTKVHKELQRSSCGWNICLWVISHTHSSSTHPITHLFISLLNQYIFEFVFLSCSRMTLFQINYHWVWGFFKPMSKKMWTYQCKWKAILLKQMHLHWFCMDAKIVLYRT